MANMFKSGTKVATQTNNTAPWAAAQPTLQKAMALGNTLVDQNTLWSPYEGQTVVGRDALTQQGMDQTQQNANAQQGNLQNPMNFLGDMFGGGGMNEQQQAAMQGMLGQMGQGGYNQYGQAATEGMQDLYGQLRGSEGLSGLQQQAAQGYQGLADQGGLSDAAQTTLNQNAGVAAGNELQGQNPAFQDILNKATENVTTSVNQNAMGQGRYGSGAHQGVLGDSIGDMTARMYSDEYGRQLGRQDAARQSQAQLGQAGLASQANMFGQIGNLGGTGIQQQQNAASGLLNAGNTGYGNQSQAYGNVFNAGQGAMQNMFGGVGAMPGAYNTGNAAAQSLMGLGEMNEDLAGRHMQAAIDKDAAWKQGNMNRVEWLNALGTGAGSLGSNGTQQALTPTASPFGQIVNGATGLLGAGLAGGYFNG